MRGGGTQPERHGHWRLRLVVSLSLLAAIFVAGLAIFAGLAADRAPDGSSKAAAPPAADGTGMRDRGSAPVPLPAPIEQIKAQVAALRGLEWKRPLAVDVVSRAEMTRRLEQAHERGGERRPAVPDAALLRLLGLIPDDLDYDRALEQLSRAQVVGFYDPDEREIVVAESRGRMTPQTLMTVAHELNHALVDQHFGFGSRLEALGDEEKAEEQAALRALVEGDARLLEYAWASRHLTEDEQVVAILGGIFGDGEPAGDEVDITLVPPFVREASRFPYDAGLDFVESLHGRGGWAAVNRAYEHPPRSTAEILHPERYPAVIDHPPTPTLDGGTGCRVERTGVLGEFDTRQLFEQGASPTVSPDVTVGWRGDRFAAVTCRSGLGMVLRWRSEGPDGTQRLARALTTWAGAWSASGGIGADGRFAGPRGAGRLLQAGDVVELVISRDPVTARQLSAGLSG